MRRLIVSDLVLFAFAAGIGTAADNPKFEVASVKPAVPQSDGRFRSSMRGGPGTDDVGQIAFTNVTLTSVLLRAYDVKNYQLSGPSWLSSQRYDIIAKIPPGTTKDQFNLMLQNLLAERFHLALHRETKDLPGYELIRGKGQLKLKPSNENGPDVEPTGAPKRDSAGFPQLSAPGLVMMEGIRGKAVVSFLTARAQPLSALADRLSNGFRLPVIDKTGLTGKFDFTLEYAPQPPGALPSPTPDGAIDAPDESAPNLLSAVQQQLGLKLDPKKVPIEMLIVDSADKAPTEN